MKNLAVGLGLLMLAGCAYSPIGTPTESMYRATNDCAAETRSDDGAGIMLAAIPAGAIGGAIAGIASSSGSDQHARYEACMEAKGWQPKW